MEILIIFLLILLNGLFSMSEMAVISSRKAILKNEADKGNKAAQRALNLSNQPNHFLSTVQVGITLIGILTGLYSGDVLTSKLAPVFETWGMETKFAYNLAQVAIVIAVTYFSIVFGELVPKRIGLSAAEKIAKAVTGPMNGLSIIAKPFVWILSKTTSILVKMLKLNEEDPKVTEEEIKSMIREGAEDGEVQQVEQDIMERVFSLGDRDLSSILTPRPDIEWIDIEMTKDEIKELITKNPYSKYPVGKEDLDHVEGIIYVQDLFSAIDAPNFDIRNIMRPVQYLYEYMEVYSALEHMKISHNHLALITDEFGTVQGIVTLKDIMEAIVGEIPEAHEEPDIIQRPDSSYLVDGQCPFYNFLSYFKQSDLYDADNEYNTIGGLILEELGHIPRSGETVEWENFKLEIIDMDGARIDKVLVSLIEK
ncbi:MAG: hemolysin family protein [Dysgonamonadaceae bacterium]|jgi:putative hemolysin|nr:hemolysin family protein [Dysgonamonadaceae bacterium]